MIILYSIGIGALIGLIFILVMLFGGDAGEGATAIPAAALAFTILGAALGLIIGLLVYFFE